MPNPLLQCIGSAGRVSEFLGESFDRIGVGDQPRGIVKTAYRNARRAMKQALQEQQRVIAASEVLQGLKSSVRGDLSTLFENSQGYGDEEAVRQLRFYGVELPASNQTRSMNLSTQVDRTLDAVEAEIARQEAAIMALILTDFQDEQIVGDEDRKGVMQEGAVLAAASYWLASLLWNSFSHRASQSGLTFQKQAIAALDLHTTETCLRVHGQIQPLTGQFELVGTPRYADNMDWSPFHGYCRTSVVLYQEAFDLGITEQLVSSANAVLAERAAGHSVPRHPADAYS